MQQRLSQLSRNILRVQEEERRAMSRSLHDDIGHVLATVLLDLQIIGKNALARNDEAKTRVEDARILTEQAIGSVRRFLRELRPEVLDQLGLIASIRQIANDFAKRTGIQATLVDSTEEVELSADQKLTLFRIVQESLTNTARHSRATNVTISVRHNDSMISASIEDNGDGFDQESIYKMGSALHLGILSMQERAKLVDGSCIVRSAKNKGTIVLVNIPFKSADARVTT